MTSTDDLSEHSNLEGPMLHPSLQILSSSNCWLCHWSMESVLLSRKKKLLQSVQNKFLCKLCFRLFILNDSSSYVFLQSRFNLPDLDRWRDYFDLAFVYKLLNNQIDCSFLLSQLQINCPCRSLRSHNMYIDCPRSNYMMASPLNRMMNVCSAIDVDNCSLGNIKRLMLGK